VDRERHAAVLRRFLNACASGDLTELVAQLKDDVIVYTDGGGKGAVPNPIYGLDKVSRLLLGLARKARDCRRSRMAREPCVSKYVAFARQFRDAGAAVGEGFETRRDRSKVFYHRPLVPDEILSDPDFANILNGALIDQTKELENHYLPYAPQFVALRNDVQAVYTYNSASFTGTPPYSAVLDNSPTQKVLSYSTPYEGAADSGLETWLHALGAGGSSVTAPDGGVTSEIQDIRPDVQGSSAGRECGGTRLERKSDRGRQRTTHPCRKQSNKFPTTAGKSVRRRRIHIHCGNQREPQSDRHQAFHLRQEWQSERTVRVWLRTADRTGAVSFFPVRAAFPG
jgi:hypothetical protein